MVTWLDSELRQACAKCEHYRAEAERRRLFRSVETGTGMKKYLALRLHAVANWLEPNTEPQVKGGI